MQALHDMAVDFIVPNLNSVVKTEEYRKLTDDLKNRLIQELADEHALVGLKRRRKNQDTHIMPIKETWHQGHR